MSHWLTDNFSQAASSLEPGDPVSSKSFGVLLICEARIAIEHFADNHRLQSRLLQARSSWYQLVVTLLFMWLFPLPSLCTPTVICTEYYSLPSCLLSRLNESKTGFRWLLKSTPKPQRFFFVEDSPWFESHFELKLLFKGLTLMQPLMASIALRLPFFDPRGKPIIGQVIHLCLSLLAPTPANAYA